MLLRSSRPSFSPRTRNSVTPGLTTEKVYGIDASYNLRYGDYKLRVSGYYTKVNDRSKVISFYDDVLKTYTNFALSGIDEQYFGLEVAASIPIYNGLSLNGAISWGSVHLHVESQLRADCRQQRRAAELRYGLLEGYARGEHSADGYEYRFVVPRSS